tara:strand:+ start:1350 stop:1595 length:246 start_codon:yes stop_codon:yes gene_type:complete
MTIQETIKTIDEPKGWLKITPSDIRNLNDYCKKLESENKQLILSGVVNQRELLLKKQSSWLMRSTTLSVEAIVEFEQAFKQ